VSDTTGPATEPTPATEPLQLADQRPVYAAAPEAAPAKPSHTRTILEVVGAVVAVFLIVGAGAVGFIAGHATSNGRGGHFSVNSQNGPQAGGQRDGQRFGQNQGQGLGGGMMGGQDPRGIDPDGDNWTGGGMMGGQNQGQGLGGGMMRGQDPRGIDPDGDNWTGGGQGVNPNAPQGTTPSTQANPSGA